jgi:predicted amidohydrolase YtcJ
MVCVRREGIHLDGRSSDLLKAAYASFQEHEVGSFAVGKRFDAVLWGKDLMTVDVDEMLETRVLATLVDGRCLFGKV